jgi:histidinol-phosphatase (PHP family)
MAGGRKRFDLHMHTDYCDGNDSAEDMVLAAIALGLDTVGISGHSYTPHDTEYCMSREDTERYIADIRMLRDKYAGRIKVLLGIERDYYAEMDNEPFDYVIGSLHYMFIGDVWRDVDDEPYSVAAFADRYFGGDMLSVAELYYRTVADIVRVTDCDIIGHIDLITKFNERFRLDAEGAVIDTRSDTVPEVSAPLIDTASPRYEAAWKKAVDRIFEDTKKRYESGRANRLEELGLLRAGDKPVFEINTGAISRGYRKTPYPAPDQIEYIRSKGGLFIMSSDSHSTGAIGFGFED